MHQWLQQTNLVLNLVFIAQLKKIVVKLRLFVADQACQRNGCTDIGKRIMSLSVVNAIGSCQSFELEGDAPFLLRPDDTFGP